MNISNNGIPKNRKTTPQGKMLFMASDDQE